MDDLDVRILRAMGPRPFGPQPKDPDSLKAARLADALGVTVKTVKDRVARLEGEGVLAGYQITPNLTHLGLAAGAFLFQVADASRKDDVVDRVRGVDGLLEVHDFLGGGLCLDVTYADANARARVLDTLSGITGDPAPLPFYARDMPPVTRSLSRLDWRILRALRWNARASVSDVADAVAVNSRTAKRRLDRMAADGSFFAAPLIDFSKATGLLIFDMLFYLEDAAGEATRRAILQAFDTHYLFTYFPLSGEMGNFNVVLFARSTAEVEALRLKGADVPGVARVEAWLFRGFSDHSRWLDDAIDARIKAAV